MKEKREKLNRPPPPKYPPIATTEQCRKSFFFCYITIMWLEYSGSGLALDLLRDLLIPVAVGGLKIAPVNHLMEEGVLQGKRCWADENNIVWSKKDKRKIWNGSILLNDIDWIFRQGRTTCIGSENSAYFELDFKDLVTRILWVQNFIGCYLNHGLWNSVVRDWGYSCF